MSVSVLSVILMFVGVASKKLARALNEKVSLSEWFRSNWHMVVIIIIAVGTLAYLYSVFASPFPVPPYRP